MSEPKLSAKLGAEALGTFWLVFGGCGSAVLAAKFLVDPDNTQLGIGFVGVALAFGLTVLTGVYALGHISGGHFNPAVSFGLWAGGRFPASGLLPYIVAQTIGATLAALMLWHIFHGRADAVVDPASAGAFATNGFGAMSPGGYSMFSAMLCEFLMTMMFLVVIMGSTDLRAPTAMAPLAIGLALTLIHLISIPVTNTSVNPARSTGVALLVGGPALQQLWFFWVVPIAGGLAGGALYRWLAPAAVVSD